MLRTWSHEVDQLLREMAGAKMPTEAAKKPETWEAFRNRAPDLIDPLPPELAVQSPPSAGSKAGRGERSDPALNAVDLSLISEARAVDAETWLEVTSWGQKTKTINYTLVGIARSMAELAVGGWERSPSAKQAKWGMEAVRQFHQRAE